MIPNPAPLYQTRIREKRRAGFLSILSVVLILLMLCFELGSVLFVRHRLGLGWELNERKQDITQRLDQVRKNLRKLKPTTDAMRNERDWISKELNIASGYFRINEYSLSPDEVARYAALTEMMEKTWTQIWSQDSCLIQEKKLSFENTHQLLKAAQ